MTTRLLFLVSHPIQYHAPLLRRIAREDGIDLTVLFERDTEAGYFDPGFGRDIRWDVPLREGYASARAAETDLAAAIAAADVVWLHGWQGAWMRRALRLARRLGKPALLRGENCEAAMPDGRGVRGMAKRLFLRWVFAHTTAFLAIGTANRRYYLDRGVAPERIFLMPYAVDNQAFAEAALRARPRRDALRARLGLEPGRKVVLFAGKLMPRKHPHTLLEAWTRAEWRGAPPHLLFVGDGVMRPALEASAGPGVVFAGFRNQGELPAFYDLADVFVLASEREPWGLAVNEAMACGTAVLAGDGVGCVPDLIDQSCGGVVPAGEAAALACALPPLLARSEQAGAAAAAKIAAWDFQADLRGLKAALAHVEAVR